MAGRFYAFYRWIMTLMTYISSKCRPSLAKWHHDWRETWSQSLKMSHHYLGFPATFSDHCFHHLFIRDGTRKTHCTFLMFLKASCLTVVSCKSLLASWLVWLLIKIRLNHFKLLQDQLDQLPMDTLNKRKWNVHQASRNMNLLRRRSMPLPGIFTICGGSNVHRSMSTQCLIDPALRAPALHHLTEIARTALVILRRMKRPAALMEVYHDLT